MAVWQNKDRQNRWMYGFQLHGARFSDYAIHPDTGVEATSRREALTIQELIRDREKNKAQLPAPVAVEGYSLAQGVAAWKPIAKRKAGWVNTRKYLAEILAFFGPGTPLDEISAARMQELVTHLLEKNNRVWIGGPRKRDPSDRSLWKTLKRTLSVVTVNKYLSALSQVLELAHETPDPATRGTLNPRTFLPLLPAVPFQPEPERIKRPIALPVLAEAHRDSPPHLKEVLIGTQLTRLRLTSLLALKGTWVDEHERGIWTDDKNKASREDFIPLGPAGLAFFVGLKRRAELVGIDRCFLYKDPQAAARAEKEGRTLATPWRPFKSVKSAFRTRLKKLGLLGQHRFHQTKTTSLNQLRKLGVDPITIHEMAQHADFKTTQEHYLAEDVQLRRNASALYEETLVESGMLRPAAENVTDLHAGNRPRTKREGRVTNTGHKRRPQNTG